jgi:hypothetical protein
MKMNLETGKLSSISGEKNRIYIRRAETATPFRPINKTRTFIMAVWRLINKCKGEK